MKKIEIGYDPYLKRKVNKLLFDSDEAPAMQLFNTEDVIKGNPSSSIAIGFVYTWPEDKPPKEIQEFFLRLSSFAFITGYWKTTNGARYVFANILSNPNVNKLILFVFGQKDNGHLLCNACVNFWKNGVDKNGVIVGSFAPNPKFEQVSMDALERIRVQTDLLVMRNINDFEKAESLIMSCFQEPENATAVPKYAEFYSNVIKNNKLYDDGARFFEPYELNLSSSAKKVKYANRPSKLPLGQTVHANDLNDALEMITAYIFENGVMFKDQRGIYTMESRSFSVTIKDPLAKVPKDYTKDYIETYVAEFMTGSGVDEFAYTYHERIFRKWGNQTEQAIELLKKNPDSRRCMISLWDPENDLKNKNPPCLNTIWLAKREGKLEMHVVFRSHHLATVTKKGRLMKGEGAFVPNLYALGTLHEHISLQVSIPRGSLVLTDFSGHLYVSDVE